VPQEEMCVIILYKKKQSFVLHRLDNTFVLHCPTETLKFSETVCIPVANPGL
jgi:hypothetical protein